MIIKSLLLSNFRCYEHKNVSFDNGLNIICGPNACGKTTILEAINCLSVTKSYRSNYQNELISYQKPFFYLECTVLHDSKTDKISLYGDEHGRIVKKNNYKFTKLSDYLGFFNVVIFSATDFLILKGSPKERRSLFDLIFCQISKDYLVVSNKYRLILKERNALLKRLMFENSDKLQVLLDVVTKQLVETGYQIMKFRSELIEKINHYAEQEHCKISSGKENLMIKYNPSVNSDFYKMLEDVKTEEIKRGSTIIGPHRDDYIFIINNKNTASFGSQGQQRNALLSTKLAMADLLYEVRKDAPVVLLDDVFSELDESRQNALIGCINNDFQTIITAASISDLNKDFLVNAKIINILEKE